LDENNYENLFLRDFGFFLVSAYITTFQDSLLEHMTGMWVLQGTIAGKETTHDIVTE
jgi:hypothetical protein